MITLIQSQSLFYWITYSYWFDYCSIELGWCGLNPYFIGLPILIRNKYAPIKDDELGLNPYFIGLPILILNLQMMKKNNR